MYKIIVIVFMLLLFGGCVKNEQDELQKNTQSSLFPMETKLDIEDKEAVQRCKNSGGIVIINQWNYRIKDCIFPPNKEQEKCKL